ncbi:MAG: hypothetical protein ACK5L3_00860 [Oscillospiraceae bacterium]
MASTFYVWALRARQFKPGVVNFCNCFVCNCLIYKMDFFKLFGNGAAVFLYFPHAFPQHGKAGARERRLPSSSGKRAAKVPAGQNPFSAEKGLPVLCLPHLQAKGARSERERQNYDSLPKMPRFI